MSLALAARVRPHLARLAAPPDTDADLLRRFVAGRDEDAFAALVRRHGPAVLAVCRRITRNPHDAEDAFQAAFLVLAKKADRVRPGEPLAAWLYGVAVRAARAALSRAYRHRSRERGGELPDVPARPADGIDGDDARAVLDEVARLAPGVRAAVVLCELEGRSRAAAARELGIPEGTLSSRLAAARKVLAARLRDRGLAAAVLAAVAASAHGARPVWSSEVSSRVTELTEAVMRTGFAFKLKLAVAAVVAVGLVAAHARPPAEEAPAPRPADPSRLVVGFPGHVRYLTPDGREVGRITGDQVKAAGADFHTRQLSVGIGTRGLEVNVAETFAPAGRATPDGRLPVATLKGLYLLGDGPAVTPVTARGGGKALFAGQEVPHIWAWAGDGKRAVARRTEDPLFGPPRFVHTLIDLGAGTADPLPLPPGHRVVDWSADGTWFLTVRAVREGSWPPDWMWKAQLCRVSADGKQVDELTPLDQLGLMAVAAAISPDGTRVAYTRIGTSPIRVREIPHLVWTGYEVLVLDVAGKTGRVVLSGSGAPVPDRAEVSGSPEGLRWSPDGRRLAVATTVIEPDRTGYYRVRVCDADGGNARVVLETDRVKTAALPALTALDWR